MKGRGYKASDLGVVDREMRKRRRHKWDREEDEFSFEHTVVEFYVFARCGGSTTGSYWNNLNRN